MNASRPPEIPGAETGLYYHDTTSSIDFMFESLPGGPEVPQK